MKTERPLLDRLVGRSLLDRLVALALAAPLCVALVVKGSTKPAPTPPIVTEEGIRLTKLVVDAKRATLEWAPADGRIAAGAVYMVQKRVGGGGWATVHSTAGTNAVVECFTVDRDTSWRIAVDLGEVDETEAAE